MSGATAPQPLSRVRPNALPASKNLALGDLYLALLWLAG